MASITNSYSGLSLTTTGTTTDNDSEFAEPATRSLNEINDQNEAGITNDFSGDTNSSVATGSNNEQELAQSLVQESINVNGMTVRYMPRYSPYTDGVWNEQPVSTFYEGYNIDMILESTAGFEGEGDVMTQYGIEFKEEVVLSLAIPRFGELHNAYRRKLEDTDSEIFNNVARNRPLEGDLIAIPFGRNAPDVNQYTPKIFEILRVTTYHDGAFFQLGDNYQYKIRARLFELSGENLRYVPTATSQDIYTGEEKITLSIETNPVKTSNSGIEDTGAEQPAIDSDSFFFPDNNDSDTVVDSDTLVQDELNRDSEINRLLNLPRDSEIVYDSFAKNTEIEERSQYQDVIVDEETQEVEKNPLLVDDLSAKSYNIGSIINDLDDI